MLPMLRHWLNKCIIRWVQNAFCSIWLTYTFFFKGLWYYNQFIKTPEQSLHENIFITHLIATNFLYYCPSTFEHLQLFSLYSSSTTAASVRLQFAHQKTFS